MNSEYDTDQYAEEAPLVKRTPNTTQIPKAFGIIAIVFGGISLISAPFNILMSSAQKELYNKIGLTHTYFLIMTLLGVAIAGILLTCGIGLLKYKNWGRIGLNVYAVFTIMFAICNSIYMVVLTHKVDFGHSLENKALGIGMQVGAYAGFLGVIFPILLLIFLNLERVRVALKQPQEHSL